MKKYLCTYVPNEGQKDVESVSLHFFDENSWIEIRQGRCEYCFRSEKSPSGIISTPISLGTWNKLATGFPLTYFVHKFENGKVYTFEDQSLDDVILFETEKETSTFAPWILGDVTDKPHYNLYDLFRHVNEYRRWNHDVGVEYGHYRSV